MDGGNENRKFDIEERAAKFGEAVIAFCKSVSRSLVADPLVSQVVRSATSIGANYCEAVSKKEFRQKIGYCKKEARETKYWFRMISRAAPDARDAARPLWQEANELHLIFSKIRRSSWEEKT